MNACVVGVSLLGSGLHPALAADTALSVLAGVALLLKRCRLRTGEIIGEVVQALFTGGSRVSIRAQSASLSISLRLISAASRPDGLNIARTP